MSAAALGESSERAARAGKPAPVEQQALNSAGRLAPPRGSGLVVSVGPAWHGYFGVQVDLSGPVPTGASLWLALVEQLPAGSDGSPQARDLVRSVAGPLPLDAMRPAPGSKRPRIGHLRAMRWPDSAQPERLQARAWLEAADGAMLAVASSRCALK